MMPSFLSVSPFFLEPSPPLRIFHVIVESLDVETPRRRCYIKIFYVITLLLLLSAPTPYFIPRVEPRGGFPYWPVPGLIIHFMFVFQIFPSIWTIFLIRKKESRASALTQNKFEVALGCSPCWLGRSHYK